MLCSFLLWIHSNTRNWRMPTHCLYAFWWWQDFRQLDLFLVMKRRPGCLLLSWLSKFMFAGSFLLEHWSWFAEKWWYLTFSICETISMKHSGGEGHDATAVWRQNNNCFCFGNHMPNEFSVPFNCSVSCEESCQMLAVIVWQWIW